MLKKDVQKFLKVLRKSLVTHSLQKSYKFKYFITSEYGSETQRPHYHSILLFYDDINIDIPSLIEKTWKYGFVQFGTVTSQSIKYTTGYYLQKSKVPSRADKNFTLISKGLGEQYIKNYKTWHLADKTRFYHSDGKYKYNLPRYLKEKIYSPFDIETQNKMLQEKFLQEDVDFVNEFEVKQNFIRKARKINIKRKL